MKPRYTGGCACGAIRFETHTKPVAEGHCQCRHCQMRSGTGHSSYLLFSGESDVTIQGGASTWTTAGDRGTRKSHAFCPTCGTPVYLTFAEMPDVVAVHAGALDDPGLFRPTFVSYRRSGPGWDRHDTELAVFEELPPG